MHIYYLCIPIHTYMHIIQQKHGIDLSPRLRYPIAATLTPPRGDTRKPMGRVVSPKNDPPIDYQTPLPENLIPHPPPTPRPKGLHPPDRR